jgi:hypothetical protein
LVIYVALIMGYPLAGDQGISGVAFYLGWLGSSLFAGILVPKRWMLAVPSAVCAVLLGAMVTGASGSELLTDPLSGVALLVLAAGETGGIRAGFAAAAYLDRSKV